MGTVEGGRHRSTGHPTNRGRLVGRRRDSKGQVDLARGLGRFRSHFGLPSGSGWDRTANGAYRLSLVCRDSFWLADATSACGAVQQLGEACAARQPRHVWREPTAPPHLFRQPSRVLTRKLEPRVAVVQEHRSSPPSGPGRTAERGESEIPSLSHRLTLRKGPERPSCRPRSRASLCEWTGCRKGDPATRFVTLPGLTAIGEFPTRGCSP